MKSFHTQMLRGNRLTNDNICINGQSCLDKLSPLPFYVDFPLLPSAFYFYSLPHSSTLFPSPPLLSPLKTSLDWTMWLEAKHKKKKPKNMRPLHSVPSPHVNEGKTFTEHPVLSPSISLSSHSSDFFPSFFPSLFSFLFSSTSSQFSAYWTWKSLDYKRWYRKCGKRRGLV